MIDQELSRLLFLSSSLDKPKADRAAKSDTKKNRFALVDACHAQDLEEVRRLVGIGAPLNISNERSEHANHRTPLAICAAHGWSEGLQELLDAGCDERLVPGLHCRSNGEPLPDNIRPRTCLDVAAQTSHANAFRLLFATHTEAQRAQSLAYVRCPALFLVVDGLGYAQRISPATQQQILLSCLPGIDPAAGASAAGSANRDAFDALASSLGASASVEISTALWTSALALQRPGILQGLALRGIMPSGDGTIEIVPSRSISADCAPSIWITETPAPRKWNPNNTEKLFNALSHVKTRVGLASAAAILSPSRSDWRNVHALVSLAPLREELMGNALAHHFLCQSEDVKLFRRLADFGCDLASLRDDKGRNPLHAAANRNEPKALMEALARVCTDWISQRDHDGKIPLDYDTVGRKQALSLLFDQIGMRESMKGRLGKRHVPAKTRRL